MPEAEIANGMRGGMDAHCSNCGAKLKYEPGTEHLQCPYCGTENEIIPPDQAIQELDLEKYLYVDKAQREEVEVLECSGCGAVNPFDAIKVGKDCLFCGAHLLIKGATKRHQIKPGALIPFKIKQDRAVILWKEWTQKLWWAPNDIKKMNNGPENIKGIYIPYWTFDAQTESSYTGARGKHRYVPETYQVREGDRMVTKTRQKRVTDWFPTAGHVSHFFDDVLVLGSESLPRQKALNLDPWNFNEAVPFQEAYLKGFYVESYSVPLERGFERAKSKMEQSIRGLIRADIGGDEQRIYSVDTHMDQLTFKLLLLPIFFSAFQFKGKTYRFLINGQTGEVQGERPYSAMKIALAIIAGFIIIGLIIWAVQANQ